MLALTRTVTPSTENGGSSTVADAAGQLLRPRRCSASTQQHRELVAAEAGKHVAGAVQLLAQPGGHQPQQVVAGVVPEAVVDLLEPVEVQQQQRAARGARSASCCCALS